MRLHVATALAALAIAAGCKTKEMSSTPFYEGDEGVYTGRAEDRVNLWPLVYWREPVCSALWPLVSFGDDHFALRPLYSQYRQGGRGSPYDEYNVLWPFGQADLASGDFTAFPFLWGRGYFAAFPAVYFGEDTTAVLPLVVSDSWSCGMVLPLAWWTHERGERAFTLFPVYSYSWTPERTWLWGACGLLGRHRADTGEYAHWALPLYLANRRGVYSVPWSRFESFDGGDVVDAYVCGLGGRTAADGEYGSSWAVPFYYHEPGRLVTPLFGWGGESDWAVPLYYRGRDSLFTLPYASWRDPDTDTRGILSAPLLTWAAWSTNSCRSSWGTLAGLVGANSNATGERRRSWAFPLYYGDAGRSFWSLPYGWTGGGTSRTNTWWATPLVGTSSGSASGWWALPLYSSHEDAGFEGLRSLPAETALSPDVAARRGFSARDSVDVLLLAHGSRAVSGSRGYGAASNVFEVVSSRRLGTRLPSVCGMESSRRAKYDVGTRRKLSDEERDSVSILWPLYRYSRTADLMAGRGAARHSVLWKLWDWKDADGDVSLDVFPGFAYDARPDGYFRASFLWRLFRWEGVPAADPAVDILFIPVWRPRGLSSAAGF